MSARKIVQIAATSYVVNGDQWVGLYALADDGTLWASWSGDDWEQREPLPESGR